MDIAAVSSGSNLVHSNGTNEIRLLEKQKEQLTDQIQRTKESKQDEKTKQKTIEALQEQIQQIDAEIQQKRNDKLNVGQKANTEKDNRQSKGQGTEDAGLTTGMSGLIQAGASYSQLRTISKVKDSLKGQENVLKIEIKLDAGRAGGEVNGKAKRLQKIESSERKLDRKIGEAINKTQGQINKAEKDSSDKDQHVTDRTDDETKNKDNSEDVAKTKSQQPDANEAKAARKYRSVDIKI